MKHTPACSSCGGEKVGHAAAAGKAPSCPPRQHGPPSHHRNLALQLGTNGHQLIVVKHCMTTRNGLLQEGGWVLIVSRECGRHHALIGNILRKQAVHIPHARVPCKILDHLTPPAKNSCASQVCIVLLHYRT